MAKKSLTHTVCDNLREIRKAAGLTQQELAVSADITVSYVSMLERRKRSPPLPTLERLCKALKVEPARLFAAAA